MARRMWSGMQVHLWPLSRFDLRLQIKTISFKPLDMLRKLNDCEEHHLEAMHELLES